MIALEKYLGRTKLQLAILAVLLVIANRWFSLGLSDSELTKIVMSLVAYIVGESFVDAMKIGGNSHGESGQSKGESAKSDR